MTLRKIIQSKPLLKVMAFGRTLGVKFRGTIPEKIIFWSPADGVIGIDWETKTIIVAGRPRWNDGFTASILIHELGHLCACLDPPDFSVEYRFLGWEWAVAKHLGLEEEWIDYTIHAGLGYGASSATQTAWAEMTPSRRNRHLQRRLAVAKSRGILDPNGEIRSYLQKEGRTKSPLV